MTIYVDPLASWGWKLRGHEVRSCHMFTDSQDLEELHALAERIGLKRAWFQQSARAPHYDLTASRRSQAVLLGAVEVDRRAAALIWRTRRTLIAGLSQPHHEQQMLIQTPNLPPCS